MKKQYLVLFVITCFLFSCKKEIVEDTEYLRCGTVFVQPLWAKNFKADSLHNSLNIINVIFHRRSPGNIIWDTSYNTNTQIRFSPDGTGKINGTQTFQYRVNLTESYPEVILSNLRNMFSLFPFPNSFLNVTSIKMRVEEYNDNSFWLIFSNGVDFYSTTNTHEESWFLITR